MGNHGRLPPFPGSLCAVSGIAAVIPRPLRRPGLLVRACLGVVCLPLAIATGEYLAIVWLVALAAVILLRILTG